MKNLDGQICISRPIGGESEHISITVTDLNSRIQFVDLKISLEDFAKALTGQGYLPVVFETRNLANVGKIKETKPLVFHVENGDYKAKERAIELCQQYADEGWTADKYFGSHKSIQRHEDGKYYAHGTQYRFVEQS